MALQRKDRIKLSTPMGEREVQLWVGDITQLPLEDQVDIIFTSAFYGRLLASIVICKEIYV